MFLIIKMIASVIILAAVQQFYPNTAAPTVIAVFATTFVFGVCDGFERGLEKRR